jgi:polyisoprenoid-binding protein YceI
MRWKAFMILLYLCWISNLSQSQTYIPVEKASSVKFFINNFGISTEGSFAGIKGDIDFNPTKLKDASFAMSVDAESVFTKNRTRDAHLKTRDYFYVEKYPTIYLISRTISKAPLKNQYWFEGELMIKDLTRQIKFLFTAETVNSGYLFKANFRINRRDYFVGSNSLVLSNNVDLDLSITTTKKTF